MTEGIKTIIYPVEDLAKAKGMKGPIGYFHVPDIRASLQGLIDAGARELQEVKDVGGGKLTATVTDTDGNVVGLVQPA